jgi:adenosylmethionine-8-amino-7-oxononanoate aminotransferase
MDRLAALQEKALRRFANDRRFMNVRQTGTIAALDMAVGSEGYLADIGPHLRSFFRDRHLLIRPLGNVIYLMPPYCVSEAEIDRLYDAIDEAADELIGTAA